MESKTEVNCYVCDKPGVLGGSKYFPFCSLECKKKYSAQHYTKVKFGSKYKTIEECQKRLAELGKLARQRKLQKRKDSDTLYKQAKKIFGPNS